MKHDYSGTLTYTLGENSQRIVLKISTPVLARLEALADFEKISAAILVRDELDAIIDQAARDPFTADTANLLADAPLDIENGQFKKQWGIVVSEEMNAALAELEVHYPPASRQSIIRNAIRRIVTAKR